MNNSAPAGANQTIADDGGECRHAEPPGEFAPWIVRFVARRHWTRRERFTIFPALRTELFFHFGSAYLTNATEGAPLRALPRAALFAPKLHRVEHCCGPRVDWFLAELSPAGAHRLLGEPPAALLQLDRAIPGPARDELLALAARMAATVAFDARVALFLEWARTRLARFRHGGDERISTFCRAARDRPIGSVAAAAHSLSLGERRFRDRFLAEIGVGPKAWLAIARGERLWTALHPATHADADPFLEYADESHAAREFRRLTGRTIAVHRAEKQGGDGLVNGGRRRVAP